MAQQKVLRQPIPGVTLLTVNIVIFFYKEIDLIFIFPRFSTVQVPFMLFFTVKNQGLLGIQIGRKSQPLRKNAFY